MSAVNFNKSFVHAQGTAAQSPLFVRFPIHVRAHGPAVRWPVLRQRVDTSSVALLAYANFFQGC